MSQENLPEQSRGLEPAPIESGPKPVPVGLTDRRRERWNWVIGWGVGFVTPLFAWWKLIEVGQPMLGIALVAGEAVTIATVWKIEQRYGSIQEAALNFRQSLSERLRRG